MPVGVCFFLLKNTHKKYILDELKQGKNMNANPFVLNPENYKRDLNIMGHYVKDASTYLSKMTGRSVEECVLFIRKSLAKGGEFEFRDPVIQYTERDDKGDREIQIHHHS